MKKTTVLFIFLLLILSAVALRFSQKSLAATSTPLLSSDWTLSGNDSAVERTQAIDPNALIGKTTLRLNYNLHGTCLIGGDASAIIFEQPAGTWHFISLSNYGKNCSRKNQTVNIPLASFPGLNTGAPVGNFHVRFWSQKAFTVDISGAALMGTATVQASPAPSATPTPAPIVALSQVTAPTPTMIATAAPSPTPSPTAAITPTQAPAAGQTWAIQSVSSMKETKDKICSPDTAAWIAQWVDRAKELGVNYVAVETPYDNPSCGSSLDYTKLWVDTIRSRGLHVWHRHMPLAFEGIYSVAKSKDTFLTMIGNYITQNPSLFQAGDIFTPIPEPQNGGISGVTYCAQSLCQFDNAAGFNQWLRNAMTTADQAFTQIGLGGKMKIGYFGFDGFVAWGDNNPDWHGILEDATIQQMGNITIDHYPQLVNDTMSNDLNELQARYPNVQLVIGEWGTVTATPDPVQQVNDAMGAAKRPNVVGFNYWHLGMGGNEALLNDDFTEKPAYAAVQYYFKSH